MPSKSVDKEENNTLDLDYNSIKSEVKPEERRVGFEV
jgi:hypothetical protein